MICLHKNLILCTQVDTIHRTFWREHTMFFNGITEAFFCAKRTNLHIRNYS